MMVRVPSYNIDRPIYIWRMEIKLQDTRTSLHTCRQGLPSFILISNNLIVEQLKKEACQMWGSGKPLRFKHWGAREVFPSCRSTL